MEGKIYLIPVTLGSDDFFKVIPEHVINLTRRLRYFIVEDIRSARRFLRRIDSDFPIDETGFFILNEHTGEAEISHYLEPVISGYDIGVMSEAGLPCIADPGARIIALAHEKNIIVTPLSGPSSIILALISSGLNGQNFSFNGYLPVRHDERKAKLRELEKNSKDGFAQIFMETPYRNEKMFESIITTCNPETKLCVAADITLPTEMIITRKISEWKKNIPVLQNRNVIFILQ